MDKKKGKNTKAASKTNKANDNSNRIVYIPNFNF